MDVLTTRHRIFDTPAGAFFLVCDSDGVVSARWDDGSDLDGSQLEPDLQPRLAAKLDRYFRGEPENFDDVPTPAGPTFHQRCWEACRTVPRGETRSYGTLAAMAGSGTGASRAVGQAMRRNPLPVIVPCHRIIAAGGRLYGYSGSMDPAGRELAIKRSLLELERLSKQ
jgi:methylated-DNA-[protein]-cysteine S-methyltransferase